MATMDRVALLSERERQVLCLLALGHSNRDIAAALTLEGKSVRNHLTSIYRTLGVSRADNPRIAAVRIWYHAAPASRGQEG